MVGCTTSYGATESVDHGSAEGEWGEGSSGSGCFVASGADDEDDSLGVVIFRFFADLVVFVECFQLDCFFFFFFFSLLCLSVCW